MRRLLRPRWIAAILLAGIVASAGGAGLARYRALASALDEAHARLAAMPGGGAVAGVLSPAEAPLSQPTVVLLVPADPQRARQGVALLRVDPVHGLVSVLVVPAALRVQRQGGGLGALGSSWASGRLDDTIRAVVAYLRVPVNHVAIVADAGLPDVSALVRGGVVTDIDVSTAVSMVWVDLRASRRITCSLGGVPTTIAGATFLQASSANAAVRDAFLGVAAAPSRSTTDPLQPGCRAGV